MQFFRLFGMDNFASYTGATPSDDAISDCDAAPVEPLHKWRTPRLMEYMGDPPRKKPLRKGGYHQSGSAHYFTSVAREQLSSLLEQKGVFHPVKIAGRENESIDRYWLTHVVDCLDFERSVISNIHNNPGQIGVVKVPVMDEGRWDGSDVFKIPMDTNHGFYCSERFVETCIKHKIKGMSFRIGYFDPSPIEIR